MRRRRLAGLCLVVLAAIFVLACTRDPNKLRAKHLDQGEKYFKAGKVQEAVLEFRNAVQADPKSADAHYLLGRGYVALRNIDAAYRELNEAVSLKPDKHEAQLQLAVL